MIENQQIAAIQKLKRENDIQRKKIEQAKSFEFSKDKRVLQHKKLEAEELKTLQEIENVSNFGSITNQRASNASCRLVQVVPCVGLSSRGRIRSSYCRLWYPSACRIVV